MDYECGKCGCYLSPADVIIEKQWSDCPEYYCEECFDRAKKAEYSI